MHKKQIGGPLGPKIYLVAAVSLVAVFCILAGWHIYSSQNDASPTGGSQNSLINSADNNGPSNSVPSKNGESTGGSDSKKTAQGDGDDSEKAPLKMGQIANLENVSITVSSPTSIEFIEEKENKVQAYLLFPVVVVAHNDVTITAAEFGSKVVDRDGCFPDSVDLKRGSVYESTLYVLWPATESLTSGFMFTEPPSRVIFGKRTGLLGTKIIPEAVWIMDAPPDDVVIVDPNNAYTLPPYTRIQATARVDTFLDFHGSTGYSAAGYIDLDMEDTASGSSISISADIPSSRLDQFIGLQHGDEIVIQGNVMSVTKDLDGSGIILKCLCLSDIERIQ